MTEKPLVSIVIPVFNGSNYLHEAIDSALNQTYENCEVLVVNDGSNDNGATEKIALSYGDRIRYFVKTNGGVASALNTGIKNMNGEYFSWLSHDDVYYPNKIKKEVDAVLKSGDRTRLVQCEYTFYDMDTQNYTKTDFHKFYGMEQLTNSVFSVLQLQIHACSALVHRTHFERVGLFDESIRTVQDIEMWFRLFRDQQSIFISQALYMVREHKEAGNRTLPGYYEETCKLYRELIKKMDFMEIERIFGSVYRFLIRMIGFLKSYQSDTRELEQLLQHVQPNEWDKRNQNEVVEKMAGRKCLIFGAGQYGIRMQYELEARGIPVHGFLDNSKGKNGKIINGILCYMPQILDDGEQSFVVVLAVRNYSGILEQLHKYKNARFITKQELDGIFSRYRNTMKGDQT